MKMKFYLIVLSLLAVCLWGTGDVRAQSASRSMTVTGKVVDQNGAAVTGRRLSSSARRKEPQPGPTEPFH